MPEIRRHTREFMLLLGGWLVLAYSSNMLTMPRFTPESLRWLHINSSFLGLLNFLLFYGCYRWIAVPLLEKQRRPLLPGILLLVLPVFTFLKYGLIKLFFAQDLLFRGYRIENHQRVDIYISPAEFLVTGLWNSAIIVIAAFSFRLFLLWLQEEKKRATLQQQQLQAESGFLKMQLNSHFLINSLNSIYSLALMGSPEVVRANKTLTQLLAYMVDQPSDIAYQAPVAEEIRYLQDFVSLQRLRTGFDEGVIFSMPDTLPDKTIAPLLLVPFVENAFKHGVSNRPGKPVTISLACNEQQLLFSVHNYVSGQQRDKTGGIGLDNVRKRLQLLYPGRHALTIRDTGAEYFSNLVINW
ncbi:sensor histidine kinase [Chitinophaga qingshengii]|uniref:Histidine kinase n=1 Tax=Chitinophaga qingshengii TaxID=1569794 RepID=A0ABR7TJI5_9BACT|nr:histidine kinase [Chitinophaga qingshengii]MBC9929830.1 histidine kinase [Chitinophaga qingshengii]